MANGLNKTTANISYYSGVAGKSNLSPFKSIPLDLFIHGIQDGEWQDIAHKIRPIQDKKLRDKKKVEICPCVTIAGEFNEGRMDKDIKEPSGFIAMDVDETGMPPGMTPAQFRDVVKQDKYCVAAFISISGRGVCMIYAVDHKKHREAFQGLSEYIYNTYHAICDPTSINISRVRFVSYDPDVYFSTNFIQFKQYPKEKEPKRYDKVVFVDSDFKDILNQIVKRKIDITKGIYWRWLKIAFALVDQFGEEGREYFHIVSQFSDKYELKPGKTDQQYDACLKHRATQKEAKIATFYYYCKELGLSIYSEATKKIAYSAVHGKKGGLNATQVAENLKKHEGLENTEDLVQSVMNNDVLIADDSLLEQLELWLRSNYDLRRNEVTRFIENGGIAIESKDFNTIFIRAKKIFDKLSFELMDRLINSDFIPTYNPFIEFFDKYKDEYNSNRCEGTISKFWFCIKSKDEDFVNHFGTKWLVGIISSIYGEHSVLCPVLSGRKQGTGKTQVWRRILPKELYDEKARRGTPRYFAQSKLDAGKDDLITLTKRLIVMDDEFGGKSKKDAKYFKEITSQQVITVREPYGHQTVDLIRIASLCGTTNEEEVVNDIEERRVVPIQVNSIDYKEMNKIDRIALFMEAYWLYHSGTYNWELSEDDILQLAAELGSFQITELEFELVTKYFEPAEKGKGEALTCSDIKVVIDNLTHQKLSITPLGKALKKAKFTQSIQKTAWGSTRRVWWVKRTTSPSGPGFGAYVPGMIESSDDLSF